MQVSIALVRALISAVERAGGDRAAFLERARIDAVLLEEGTARLSVEDYVRAMEAALAESNDPALGLHLGQYGHSSMFHVVAHLVEHAETLGEGVELMLHYSGILAAGFEPQLIDPREPCGRRDQGDQSDQSDQSDYVALRLPYLVGEGRAVRLTAEFAMAGFMRLLRHYLGQTARPHLACFAYATPRHAQEYRSVFEGAERFDQPFTEMWFPRAWLSRRQMFADSALAQLLKSHAERELAHIEHGGTMAQRVERVLSASDLGELPTMPEVARQLDISARTLARKLQSEGASFAQLLDERRTCVAKSLLERRCLTIQQVAATMGFSDAPSFHRAFRRWTGLTPRQYVASVSR